jgi:hypothetical protein
VSFSPGLQTPARGYWSFGERMASHGMIVVLRDDPGIFTETPDVVDGVVYVVTQWLPAQNEDSTSPLFGKVDLSRVGLTGHSRGGKTSLLAAEHELNDLVLGWFGLDPVDSSTLAGNEFANQSEQLLDIPLVFLFAQVESNCSPASTTEAALWPTAPSPAVKLVGLGAGHEQMGDPEGCAGCPFCSPDGNIETETVLRYSRRYLTAFMARELLGDTTVGPALEGAGVALDVDAGLITVESR